MGLKKKVFGAIAGMLVVGAASLPLPVLAHPATGPTEQGGVCAFTSAAGLPANINNVEGKGGGWSIDPATGWWAGTGGTDGDPMTAQDGDGLGHGGQLLNQGRRGLYYPVTDPDASHRGVGGNSIGLPSFVGDHFNWTNTDQCNNTGASISTKGVGIGYCGRSVGIGLGTTAGHSTITKWESTASQLHLTDRSAVGTLNAQPNPPGSPAGSCLSGTATTFNLNGAVVHT